MQLTLYSRAGCHLCDEMLAGLRQMQPKFPFTIDVVDVDHDPRLAARYGTEIPVLAHEGHELCRHRIDTPQIVAYLSRLRDR